MATDVIPSNDSCVTETNEQQKFALNLNGKKVVRVEDEAAVDVLNAILVALGGTAGTPFFSETQTTTTGALQTLITEVVPVSTTRNISKLVVVCRRSANFELKINSTVIASGRTGAGSMNTNFVFSPSRPASAGDTITLEFTQISGPLVDVEAYLMATDI